MNYLAGYSLYRWANVRRLLQERQALFSRFFLGLVVLLLSGCSTNTTYAPVIDINPVDPLPKTGKHHVKRGETLYEIAWRYGLDYQYLANRNHLNAPYRMQSGQVINVRGKAPSSQKLIPSRPVTTTYSPITKRWMWPAEGRVISTFTAVNKGINIAGRRGSPVVASKAGKIVYSGNGLRSYGNLIIIKHNNLYLSAYAHNKRLLVREGEWVKQGQQIAEMGESGTNQVMLHFEIRRGGLPINPLTVFHA